MYEKLYSKIVDSLVDDGFIVINNALDANLPSNLVSAIEDENSFKKAGISGSRNLHIDSNKRRDKIRWLKKTNLYEKDFLDFSEGLREYLNRELYLGLSYYESHFAIYNKGDFYEKHLDCFKNSKNRVVTTVYYLNECEGGELVVYDNKNNLFARINPTTNTLVVFMSEKFPHEVLRVKSKRYSIAGWFRIDKA